MKIKRGQSYVIFECCRLVKGQSRSLFYDIQRNAYRFIPNELAELIIQFNGKTIDSLKQHFDHKYDEIIDQNLSLLEEEEFIFYTDNPEWFPPMSLEWDEPTPITNGIVDVDPKKIEVLLSNDTWEQFSNLGCEHIQIRIFENSDVLSIERQLELIGSKRIISVEIIMKWEKTIVREAIIDFVYRQPRVSNLMFHSADEDNLVFESPTLMGNIYKTT